MIEIVVNKLKRKERVKDNENSINHRYHRSGRQLSGRILIRERLRGAWHTSSLLHLQHGAHRAYPQSNHIA